MTIKPTSKPFLDEAAHADKIDEIAFLMSAVDDTEMERAAFYEYEDALGELGNALGDLQMRVVEALAAMVNMNDALTVDTGTNLDAEIKELETFAGVLSDYAQSGVSLIEQASSIDSDIEEVEAEAVNELEEVLEEAVGLYDSSEIKTIHADWFGYNSR